MMRSIGILALVSAMAAACSPASTPPPNAASDKPSTPAPASDPAATAQPGAAPAASAGAPVDQAQPASPAPAAPPNREAAAAAPAAEPTTRAPAEQAAAPAPPPVPRVRELTIPADTLLTVTLQTPVASDASHVEDAVRGTLAKPIVVSGRTVVPAGAEVIGSVIEAHESGRVKGKASIAFRFDHIVAYGDRYAIRTARVRREAGSSTRSDVKKGGIGAAAGAIIGGIAGGGKGAAIGAGVGGTGAVLATKGKEVRLGAGATVSTRLQEAVTVMVPTAEK